MQEAKRRGHSHQRVNLCTTTPRDPVIPDILVNNRPSRPSADARTSVDSQHNTGEIAGPRRTQPQHNLRNLLRFTRPRQRNRRNPAIQRLSHSRRKRPGLGIDQPRTNAVDQNAMFRQFHSRNPRETLGRRATAGIRSRPRRTATAHAGREVDDPPTLPLRDQHPRRRLCHQERATAVDREHRVPHLDPLVQQPRMRRDSR